MGRAHCFSRPYCRPLGVLAELTARISGIEYTCAKRQHVCGGSGGETHDRNQLVQR